MIANNQGLTTQTLLLNALVKQSVDQLKPFIGDVVAFPIDRPIDISDDHWVASVLLDATKAQIYFRVHFKTAHSRQLLGSKVGSGDYEAKTTHDFIKEYCNMVMGKIKAALGPEIDAEAKKKVFIPQVDPSYDRFAKIPTGQEVAEEERWWRMLWPKGEMNMYAKVKSDAGFTENVLNSLSQDKVVTVDNEGDIDFF